MRGSSPRMTPSSWLCPAQKTKTPPQKAAGLCVPQMALRSDRHLEVLGGAEGHLLGGLDLDRLAGRRVAAHAGGALAHLQDAEAGDLHPLALLQVIGDQADEVVEHFLALALREFVLFRQCIGQLLGGDRLSGLRYVCHGRLLLMRTMRHDSSPMRFVGFRKGQMRQETQKVWLFCNAAARCRWRAFRLLRRPGARFRLMMYYYSTIVGALFKDCIAHYPNV